jgi:hypothetical protein
MKKLIFILTVVFSVSIGAVYAQDITRVEATSYDISENLDLKAVASVFGESKDLEDFEYKLNDPELQISNLDLNRDGYVDYLRVVENSEKRTILITIQAVIGKDLSQDVATIDIVKDSNGRSYVQVVGDVYMYGADYIIEPIYVYSPPVVLYLWGSSYRRWHSPYYWQYYPTYYHAWHPYTCHVYHNNIHVHVNVHHRYYYPKSRRSSTAANIHNRTRRNDYARCHPNRSFSSRNEGVRNTHELNRRQRTTQRTTVVSSAKAVRSTNSTSTSGRNVQSTRSNSSQSSVRSEQGRISISSRQSKAGSSQSRNSNSRVSQSRSSKSNYSRSGNSQARQSNTNRSSGNNNESVRSGRSSSSKSGGKSLSNSRSGSSKRGRGR